MCNSIGLWGSACPFIHRSRTLPDVDLTQTKLDWRNTFKQAGWRSGRDGVPSCYITLFWCCTAKRHILWHLDWEAQHYEISLSKHTAWLGTWDVQNAAIRCNYHSVTMQPCRSVSVVARYNQRVVLSCWIFRLSRDC